ncbi:MFS family permease [Povalibacter uvarum]|uniref:MFS family permease n=1 Tax=Povalibacter uvarum TaxID=732238 RepID=A0A841HM80_9GAMM|nr:MFS transporter [Povalibacter uvarum]MBB6093459.1 MFS family permease [Povalibacter uvarum]
MISREEAALNAPAARSAETSEEFRASEGYRYYVVWLLCGVYMINMMDRQLLSILVEPIRTEFGLTDTHMGFLTGLAFAAVYTVMGVPLARLADRSSRVNLIAISIVVWSAFTALTGTAKTYVHLLVARVGVGIGEAGCNPAAYSLISDYFESKRRATALSIYQLGAYAGSFLGMLLAGWVAHTHGWRMAFFVVGLPGLVIALLVKITLREPPRGFSDETKVVSEPPSAWVVIRSLLSKPSFRHLAFAAALHNFVIYGAGNFYSAFLMRSHGMSVAEVGFQLAIVTVVGGVAGTYFGGWLSDWFANRRDDIRYYLWIPALSLVVGFPISELVFFIDDPTIVMWLLIPSIFCAAAYLAPSITATYRLVGVRERALASALLLFILNLIGLGFGPLLVGVLSDSLRSGYVAQGIPEAQALADGLRWSLRATVLVNLWAAVHYFLAARTLRQETLRA